MIINVIVPSCMGMQLRLYIGDHKLMIYFIEYRACYKLTAHNSNRHAGKARLTSRPCFADCSCVTVRIKSLQIELIAAIMRVDF